MCSTARRQVGQRRSCCRQRCRRVCDKQEENAALESRRNGRIKTKTDMDMHMHRRETR